MADSFFTSRNHFDEQMERWPDVSVDQMVEACVRHTVRVKGPLEAAMRLQRLSDLCVAKNVLPIEHWQALASPAPAALKEPRTGWPWRQALFGPFSLWSYALGFLVGGFDRWWPW